MSLKTAFYFTVLLGLFFSVSEPVSAQRVSREVRKAERERERKKRKDFKNYQVERERRIQEHIDRQTPKVRERMINNRKESERKKRRPGVPFYKKWLGIKSC